MSFSERQLTDAREAAQKALQEAISVPQGETAISEAVSEALFPHPTVNTGEVTTRVTWHEDPTWRTAHVHYPGGEFGVSLT